MFEIADFIGIISFAFSGAYIGARKGLDLLGISIAAFLTALGGGIIRDTILGISPISLITITPFIIVVSVIITTLLSGIYKKENFDNKPFFVFIDSIGLMSFSIAGALISIEHNFSFPGIIIIAFISAVGGGILRDIIMNEIPYVMKGGFYGSIAIITAISIYFMNIVNMINPFTLSIIFFVGVILRNIAFKYNFELLKVQI